MPPIKRAKNSKTLSYRSAYYKNDISHRIKEGKAEDIQREHKLEWDTLENWLEVGSISLGPVLLEGASALPIPDHKLHLVQHKY